MVSTSELRVFEETLGGPLHAAGIGVLQINVGKVCNQRCAHCHVDAGPERRETMTRETAELCVDVLRRHDIPVVDITGGAPELCAQFRYLVTESRRLGRKVMDRCNLTILLVPSQSDLIEFLAHNDVEIVASLPCYLESNVDRQRGGGVYARSIEALRRLNAAGYGIPGSALRLNLVYNPVGASLPPPQAALEDDYRRELRTRHGIEFHSLFTMTNMPISRFLGTLQHGGQYDAYMHELETAFNAQAAQSVMCRDMVSVGWDGTLYDCDFNQMLEMPVGYGAPPHIREFDAALLRRRRIVTGNHCYACTAGQGSSCGGATIETQFQKR